MIRQRTLMNVLRTPWSSVSELAGLSVKPGHKGNKDQPVNRDLPASKDHKASKALRVNRDRQENKVLKGRQGHRDRKDLRGHQ